MTYVIKKNKSQDTYTLWGFSKNKRIGDSPICSHPEIEDIRACRLARKLGSHNGTHKGQEAQCSSTAAQ